MMEKLVEQTVLLGETKVLGENMPRRHFVQIPLARPGREPGPPRWEGSTNRFSYGAAHLYTYIHTHMHTNTHIYTYIQAYISTYLFTITHVYTRMCMSFIISYFLHETLFRCRFLQFVLPITIFERVFYPERERNMYIWYETYVPACRTTLRHNTGDRNVNK
jgi:hypothetical protein